MEKDNRIVYLVNTGYFDTDGAERLLMVSKVCATVKLAMAYLAKKKKEYEDAGDETRLLPARLDTIARNGSHFFWQIEEMIVEEDE